MAYNDIELKYHPATDGHKLDFRLDFFPQGFGKDELRDAMFGLAKTDRDGDLLLESATLEEIEEAYCPGEIIDVNVDPVGKWHIYESVKAPLKRLDKKLQVLKKAIEKHAKGITVETVRTGKQRKVAGQKTITIEFLLSDMQSIFGVFSAPNVYGGKAIKPSDTVIAFRWLLNKKDVTHLIEPAKGRDVGVQTVGLRLAQLAEENSAAFQKRSTANKAAKVEVDNLKDEVDALKNTMDAKQAELKDQQDQGEDLDMAIADAERRLAKMRELVEDLKSRLEKAQAGDTGDEDRQTGEEEQVDPEIARYDSLREELAAKLTNEGFEETVKADGPTDKREWRNMENDIYVGTQANPEQGGNKRFMAWVESGQGDFKRKEFGSKGGRGLPGLMTKTFAFVEDRMQEVGEKLDEQFGKKGMNMSEFLEQWVKREYGDDSSALDEIVRFASGGDTDVDPEFQRAAQKAMAAYEAYKGDGGTGDEVEPEPTPGDDYTGPDEGEKEVEQEEATEGEAEPEPETTGEPDAVNTLNDIISGRHDDNPDMIDSLLDQAAEELESAGLMEKYDDILNQAADKAAQLAVEAAREAA